MHIGILEGDGFSPKAIEVLRALGSVEVYAGGSLSNFLSEKQALFVRLGRRVDEQFLRQAPTLRYLCSPTTGHEHLDIDALARRSIKLLSLRGEREFLSKIRATPEHTVGLMIALLRNYKDAFLSTANDRWDRNRLRGHELYGSTVGLIGFGRVGRILNDYLRAFGSEVLFLDPDPGTASSSAIRCNSLEELIARSRIVVLCASRPDGTGPILIGEHLTQMRGKYFVNTARGELVDEAALLDRVRANHFAGVAIDVIANENGPNKLRDWLKAAEGRNVIVTPHIAGATYRSMHATEEFIVDKLKAQLMA